MRVAIVIAVACSVVACKRTPPPGSGAIETTGMQPGGDGASRAYTMTPFPGGAVLVTDAITCTVARYEVTAKGAQWTALVPQCQGALEAVVAPDSVSYVRTPAALVAIAPDGKEKWRANVDNVSRALLTPAVTPDSLVIVAASARVVIGFRNDGSQAFRFSVAEDETLMTSPLGSRGEGVFLLTNRALYNVGSDGAVRYRRARPQT
jgi:hypothetical protein